MAKNSFYFVSGRGLKMYFNGNVYQNPDQAALEEGQRLAKIFKNVKVIKVTGNIVQTIFKAPGRAEKIQQNLRLYFCQR